MSWVVLAIAVGFWLRASVERAAVVRPAPMPLVALAETECQGACALYSWLAIRGEGKA